MNAVNIDHLKGLDETEVLKAIDIHHWEYITVYPDGRVYVRVTYPSGEDSASIMLGRFPEEEAARLAIVALSAA